MPGWVALLFLALSGCGTTHEPSRVTVAQIRALGSFDALLPVEPDSVVRLYRESTPENFHVRYSTYLEMASYFLDSMNLLLPRPARIDTLAIDHGFDSFGEAAFSGRTIYLSSSYFLIYNDFGVIRSVLSHEIGHVLYRYLPAEIRDSLENVWERLREASLLYLFRDGEYSENARFGGHPYESASELFASAFNLFRNKSRELASRLQYVDQVHLPDIQRLKEIVARVARRP